MTPIYNKVTPKIIETLQAIVGNRNVIHGDPEQLERYSHDEIADQHYAAMPDILNGQYSAYLTPFGSESGEQPATLRDRVHTAANDVPKVFAMVQVDPTPRVIFIHRPTRYEPSLIGAQPWDDRIFGFQGDMLRGNQINLVEWPATPFARSVAAPVPTVAQVDTAWANSAGADALGPFGANDPDTEQLRARFLCPVPHKYVSICINRSYTHEPFGPMS